MKYTVIKFNLYFMVHGNVWKFEKIWLSGMKYTVIKFNLYFMVHGNVWKFEKIWLSGTLIIIRKPKVWRTDMRIPIYSWLSSSGGIKSTITISGTHIKLAHYSDFTFFLKRGQHCFANVCQIYYWRISSKHNWILGDIIKIG